VVIHEVIELDEKMTIHVNVSGSGASGEPYSNEIIQVVHFVPASESIDPRTLPKMRLVKEFVDSLFSRKFFTEERAKAKEKEAKSGQMNSGSSLNNRKV